MFRHNGAVTALAVSSDGKRVASAGSDRIVRVWDSATGHELTQFRTPPDRVTALAFSTDPEKDELLVEDVKVGLALWNLKTGHRRKNWHGQGSGVEALVFSSDGKRLVTIGRDGKLVTIDLTRPQGQQRDRGWEAKEQSARFWWRLFHGSENSAERGATYAIAFTPDARTVYAIDRKLDITQLDVATGRIEMLKLMHPKENRNADVLQPVSVVALSANSRWAAWGNGDNQIGLVDVPHAKATGLLSGHKSPVVTLAFTPDGLMLASADTEGQVICWTRPDSESPFEARKSGMRFRAALLMFSPDGKRLYGASSDGDVNCWDTATLNFLQPMPESEK